MEEGGQPVSRYYLSGGGRDNSLCHLRETENGRCNGGQADNGYDGCATDGDAEVFNFVLSTNFHGSSPSGFLWRPGWFQAGRPKSLN